MKDDLIIVIKMMTMIDKNVVLMLLNEHYSRRR